ncbi:SusC/RagA family TonB-linked outer membrane protein [Seonamhaeicola maritimus]|nr:TonB-dependent receptor [Seonamhaeicola maritimus]
MKNHFYVRPLMSYLGQLMSLKFDSKFKLSFVVFAISFLNINASTSSENIEPASDQVSTQQITVSGTVSDIDGPLPGVNILVKGTSQGTQTDFDGNYSLSAENGAILVFSYLGYKTQEVAVGNNTTINVTLEADVAGLDEVVVVGYGTRTRGELTGAVSTLKSEEIERTSSGNLSKSLAGKIPGLTVNDRGGYPGENNVQVFVRGRATLGNNAPLYVIDGVPSNSQAFSFLAPGDIANMSVLKDAAAAIYGARAANGVILVTTKRGKSGKAKISLSTTQQIQQFTRTPRFMNSFQYTTYQNEVDSRHGNPLQFTDQDIENFRIGNDPIQYPDTNWFDLTMNDWAHQQRHSINVSGGSENIKYFVNGDMLDQGGQYKSGDLSFEQYQLRTNLDIKVNDRIKLGVDLYGLSGKRVQPGVSRGFIYKHLTVTLPTEVGQYPNGLYGVAAEDGANPAIMSSFAGGFNDERNTEFRTRFNLDVDLGFITEGLGLNANTTITRRTGDAKHLTQPWTNYAYNPTIDEYVPQVGFDFNSGNTIAVRDSFWKYNEEYINAQLKYDRTFGDHTLRGFVAVEQTKWRGRNFNAYKRDLPSALLPDLFAGGDEGRTAFGVSNPGRARQNYFGSLSYNYQKKYLIDFTLRYDGSDIFPEGQKYGTFPGVQVGWVITKEPFMEGTSGWLNNLKLRASWAQIGNDRVAPFAYLDQFGLGGGSVQNRNYYIFGESPGLANSFYLNSIGNPNVTWESATTQNIGLSFSLFDSKLNGDFNYYWGDRSDILTSSAADIPSHAGLDLGALPNENIGIVDNWGWEFELNYADEINEDLSYSIGGNIANAQNEIVYMAEAAGVPDWRKQEGHALGSFQSYPTDGIYQTQAEIDADPAAGAGTLPGDIKYVDTDGNGQITGNDVVRRYTSNVPEITYSFNTGLKYKNFDLNLLFQGQANANIAIFFDNSGNRPAYLFEQRWTPENPNGRYPRAYERADTFNAKSSANNAITADTWIHDASFLRLRELQIGYNIPKSATKFADLRVFLRGSNVFTWDKLKGLDLDPEMPGYRNFEQGLYQPLKTWSLGVNINL